MSLVQRARIEAYLPLKFDPAYQHALDWLVLEFSYSFGGCTILEHVAGYYLDQKGDIVPDRINIVYTDTPLELPRQQRLVEEYIAGLKTFLTKHLYQEEAILITAHSVFHDVYSARHGLKLFIKLTA
ncbi:MAG: hypothetical protein L0229_25075, partial [Blastocatellia bacterium]|nr:hypothetical protein [Blastocatellia bacterium]